MSFGAPKTAVRETGFYRGRSSEAVLGPAAEGSGNLSAPANPVPVGSMGEENIMRSEALTAQGKERIFHGAPRFWNVINRAEKGNVKVWRDVFNGEVYPEGATDDKSTWLQPGEAMMIPLEAALHFFGNLFDPKLTDARDIIERTGGMELETEASAPGRNPPVRPIGPPIALPDFLIQPFDGRSRPVGQQLSLYDLYFGKVKGTIVRRRGHDHDVLEAEKTLLAERISDYTNNDRPLYGPDDKPIASTEEPEPATSRRKR